jgi:hypothetical protein
MLKPVDDGAIGVMSASSKYPSSANAVFVVFGFRSRMWTCGNGLADGGGVRLFVGVNVPGGVVRGKDVALAVGVGRGVAGGGSVGATTVKSKETGAEAIPEWSNA